MYQRDNIADYYQFSDVLNKVEYLNSQIQLIMDTKPDKETIEAKIDQVNNFLVNYNMAASDEDGSENPDSVLVEFNSWSDFNTAQSHQFMEGKCKVIQDEWVWSNEDCQYKS